MMATRLQLHQCKLGLYLHHCHPFLGELTWLALEGKCQLECLGFLARCYEFLVVEFQSQYLVLLVGAVSPALVLESWAPMGL